MNTQILEEIGLGKGEIKVYFALLELGESTIGPISKKARVTPAKTYPILQKLTEKGLITRIIKSNTQHYQAFNPKRILDYIKEKKKKLEHEEREIEKMIPQLMQKQKFEAKQSASLYNSYRGLKTLYNEFIETLQETKEDFIAFTLGDEYEDSNLMFFFEHYDLVRKELGIKTKLIGIEKQRKFFDEKYMKNLNLETKYLPYSAVPQGVIIVGDKVATMLWHPEPTAFVIQSEIIANSYKQFFSDLWKLAKK